MSVEALEDAAADSRCDNFFGTTFSEMPPPSSVARTTDVLPPLINQLNVKGGVLDQDLHNLAHA